MFDEILLRLKERLGVQTDKEIAKLLGLSPNGFNDRKRRGSFPADKLYALAAQQPNLNLDVLYILTGTKPPNALRKNAESLVEATFRSQPDTSGELFKSVVELNVKQSAVSERRLDKINEIERFLYSCADDDFEAAYKVYLSLRKATLYDDIMSRREVK